MTIRDQVTAWECGTSHRHARAVMRAHRVKASTASLRAAASGAKPATAPAGTTPAAGDAGSKPAPAPVKPTAAKEQ
jgi:hypothetical protein